jgi:hypothetical protein
MMKGKYDEAVSSLRSKIKEIISLYEEQKIRNRNLESRNKELLERVSFLEKKIADTEDKYINTKLAKAILASGENPHDAKIKVNRIVREIDKCIALLNK